MDAGECSTSASSPSASTVWAKLVPADSAGGEELAWCDAVVCSLVTPAGGEELAWCEIRRGGDASSATIRNLRFWGNSKNQSRKRPLSHSSDEINNPDMSCPQCCNEFGGFRCSPRAAHLQCNRCGGMIPARSNISIPQKCLGCDRAFCGAYW